jgi:hypothetical protein
MYAVSRDISERIAARLNSLADTYVTRPTNRYVVEPYPDGSRGWRRDTATKFGVIRRWRYADRPELGEFGGEFMWLGYLDETRGTSVEIEKGRA